MKKEYIAIIIVALFILGTVMDFLAGPINLPLKNPFDFLQKSVLSIYPFTGISVLFKTLAIVITIVFGMSLIKSKYLAKGSFLFFLVALFELYSIQQIATGARMVPLEWSIAFAFTGILLLLPAIFYFLIGSVKLIHHSLKSNPYDRVTTGDVEEDL